MQKAKEMAKGVRVSNLSKGPCGGEGRRRRKPKEPRKFQVDNRGGYGGSRACKEKQKAEATGINMKGTGQDVKGWNSPSECGRGTQRERKASTEKNSALRLFSTSTIKHRLIKQT